MEEKTDGAKLTANPVSLRSLPPIDKPLELKIVPAHHQAMMWNNCMEGRL